MTIDDQRTDEPGQGVRQPRRVGCANQRERTSGVKRLAPYSSSPSTRMGCVLALFLLVLGCAAKDVYWQQRNADEAEFRKASRVCNRTALLALSEEGGEQCGYNTEGRGTFCRRVDPNDPFQVEQEKRRQERRLRFLYGECMEGKGWISNTAGKGFKGRY